MCVSTFPLSDVLDLGPDGHLSNSLILDIREDISESQPSLWCQNARTLGVIWRPFQGQWKGSLFHKMPKACEKCGGLNMTAHSLSPWWEGEVYLCAPWIWASPVIALTNECNGSDSIHILHLNLKKALSEASDCELLGVLSYYVCCLLNLGDISWVTHVKS